jgi:hypothetical protein
MENSSKLSRCEPGAAQLHIWVVCLGAQAEGAFGELGALLYREARKKRAPCAEALAAAFGLSLSMMINMAFPLEVRRAVFELGQFL